MIHKRIETKLCWCNVCKMLNWRNEKFGNVTTYFTRYLKYVFLFFQSDWLFYRILESGKNKWCWFGKYFKYALKQASWKLINTYCDRPFATNNHTVQNPPCWRASSLLFPQWDIKTKASHAWLVEVSLF